MAYGDVHEVTQQYLAYEERRIAQQGGPPVKSAAIGQGIRRARAQS
jgi:hypothetical protein